MHTFAQKQNQPQQQASSNTTRSNTVVPAASYPIQQSLSWQLAIGNQAVPRLSQAEADGLEAHDSSTRNTTGLAHDLSQTTVSSKTPVKLQAKLTVNTPGDIYEQEADRVADQVTNMPEPQLQRACACGGGCPNCREQGEGQEDKQLQAKHVQASDAVKTSAPPIVHDVLRSPSQPLDAKTRAFFEPRFGHDFSQVRVHADLQASDAARDVAAQAFTVGEHIVFGKSRYAPGDAAARHLLAHELTHVVQQRAGGPALQRRAANCPATPPSPPTITTMADFIALVKRVEASTTTGSDPIATARLISRTKYEGRSWDWLLPTTKGQAGAVAGGTVTTDDIGSLCFKLIVTMPGGGSEDPMHIIAAIVADAETKAAGTGATGLSAIVAPLPASVSQRSASTWVGDVGKAAASWMIDAPLPNTAKTKDDYMLADAPPHDLMGNVDGVAMTSKSAASGFAFDKTKPLSDNLQRFFTPAKGTGRERRFHIFCSAEGFALEADGVTLTAAAKATIGQRVKDFAMWFKSFDPSLVAWTTIQSQSPFQFQLLLARRMNDWQWFADQFITFVQNNLTAEGP
jgi:hypothetical protein